MNLDSVAMAMPNNDIYSVAWVDNYFSNNVKKIRLRLAISDVYSVIWKIFVKTPLQNVAPMSERKYFFFFISKIGFI